MYYDILYFSLNSFRIVINRFPIRFRTLKAFPFTCYVMIKHFLDVYCGPYEIEHMFADTIFMQYVYEGEWSAANFLANI